MALTIKYTSKSLEDTEKLGKALARAFESSSTPFVSFLEGPFGAGKTTLIKTIIAELASVRQESIASPTFQYVSLYQDKKGLPIAHFDLWRLSTPHAFFSLGLEDILSSSLSFVEWPEKLGTLCPKASLIIRILAPHESEREFEIDDRANILPKGFL